VPLDAAVALPNRRNAHNRQDIRPLT
jgi:hypothetical protein